MLGKTGNSPLLLLWEKILQIGYLTVKEEMLIYNPQTSFPNNESTDVGLGIKPKSTNLHLGLISSPT